MIIADSKNKFDSCLTSGATSRPSNWFKQQNWESKLGTC